MSARVALVNTNRIRPPIAPLGLEYVAEALCAAGHAVEILDLCWHEQVVPAVEGFFGGAEFDLVGVTLRNTDDCTFTGRQSFLEPFARVVRAIRQSSTAPIVVGGVGFSVAPEPILEMCRADAGVWGEGEFVFVELADRVSQRREWHDLPNLILPDDGGWRRNPPSHADLAGLPAMKRRLIDNARYFREGGQAGFETKRGCAGRCTYCADPVAKGREVRVRPPAAVACELESLLDQGIDHLHTCDSEFNLPAQHAAAVCEEIVRRRLGERLRWYAYCSPAPFSPQLAGLMQRAGCVGINFGVDSGDEAMLKRLRRDFVPEDVSNATRACREAGMAVMLDLLLGAPGETPESIARTVDMVKAIGPDRAGVSLGVRVYPGTELAEMVRDLQAGLEGGESPHEPLFFLDPQVASVASDLLDDLIDGDERFLFFDSSRPTRNYNYNANDLLERAIREGSRGAYWDILRRYV